MCVYECVCVCLVTEYDTVDVLFKLITLDMLLFFIIMRRKQLHNKLSMYSLCIWSRACELLLNWN